MFTLPCHIAHVSIQLPPSRVYAFASDPLNLPQWAAGLSSGIEPAGDHWLIQTPQGQARLDFAPQNPWGVLDHTVTLPSNVSIYVPMRVVANEQGCEVTLILYRQTFMTDEDFEKDIKLVIADLKTLKAILEDQA